MTEPLRTWLEAAHHPAHLVGGWAFVCAEGGAVSGWAAGERRVGAERTALLALLAALKGLPAGRPVRLYTSSPLIAALPPRLAAAEAGGGAPEQDLDLWAALSTALAARPLEIARDTTAAGTPGAFAAAWAELARDRAKDRGPFTSAIPKPNLAKAGVR